METYRDLYRFKFLDSVLISVTIFQGVTTILWGNYFSWFVFGVVFVMSLEVLLKNILTRLYAIKLKKEFIENELPEFRKQVIAEEGVDTWDKCKANIEKYLEVKLD